MLKRSVWDIVLDYFVVFGFIAIGILVLIWLGAMVFNYASERY